MSFSARVILDSVGPNVARLTTFELVMPRIVLAEFNTHRMFCLAGDAELEFDTPAGQGDWKRVYKMRIDAFVDRWINGSAPRANNGGAGTNRQPMVDRLKQMRIRQLNERTGLIETSTVLNAYESGTKPVYEVSCGNKFRIAGSKDHRILTDDGWKTIGDLSLQDSLVVRRRGKRDEDLLDPLRLKKIGGRWRSVWQRQIREERMREFGGCQQCSSVDDLQIHHVVPVYQAPDRAFDETNVSLLCHECHEVAHETQGWQGGTYLYGDTIPVTGIRKRGTEPTFDLEIAGEFPNFIANGVVVHNSRNSASSRAIPIEKMIKRIEENAFVPTYWGKNQKGMQADEELDFAATLAASETWNLAANDAIKWAKRLIEIGVHKQITNRLLEPFMWHTVVFTATELENFIALRNNKMAAPEIQEPARLLVEAYEKSTPMQLQAGEWHLPFVTTNDVQQAKGDSRFKDGTFVERRETGGEWSTDVDWLYWAKISAARCARTSYLTHEGKRDLDDDEALYDKLVSSGHMSPLEHPAQALTQMQWKLFATEQCEKWISQRIPVGNFFGFKQFRKTIPNEHDFSLML